MIEPSSSRVVCAAIRIQHGDLNLIIAGARHYDYVMRSVITQLEIDIGKCKVDQGFIDQHGKFLTREEAWLIAETQNQIITRVGGDTDKLYSENLY